MESKAAANMGLKKVAVQWLIGQLRFVSSVVLADSLVLRNRQLLVAAKRYWKPYLQPCSQLTDEL
jgi:hypothetical protein